MDSSTEGVISFQLEATSGHARAGRLVTRHGVVETPAFQPVATRATVKALAAEDVWSTGARLVIMNTYHLWLRPGAELIAEQGGLHRFARWSGSITTDSGGFQAFSLAERVKVSEQGFEFSSHLDGRRLKLGPEEAMRIQGLLGSDIAMQLDICAPGTAARAELVLAVERTTRWAERCLAARTPGQAVFGIIQGGTDLELRLRHAEELARLPFDGLALGGFSVGEPIADMYRVLERVGPAVDPRRPHYLMGVGTPEDLIRAIGFGIDMFDCVLPSRNARNGQAFVSTGKLVIKNARYQSDPRPLEEGCGCAACSAGYSRAYLRHLYLANEISAHRLITLHNIWHYQRLVADARRAIVEGRYSEWAADKLAALTTPAPSPN
ncbi:MAG TPA: tRNA guanosine(34) transglycosylase Tgt [Polyangiaceae bacterium]|nr:tRNA guanosine(34) transglycosylase Tgt [Polyangiaceae bacterium]